MQELTNVCFYISIALISCSSTNTNTRLNEIPKVTDTIDIQKINKEFNRKVKKEISGFIGKFDYHPKYLQNFDKRLDMGKHPFILVITIYFIHFL